MKRMMVSSSNDGGSGSSASRWPLVGYTGEERLWLWVAAMEVAPVGFGVKCGDEVHVSRSSRCGLVVGGLRALLGSPLVSFLPLP